MKTSFMIFWIVVAFCLCVLINVTDDNPLCKSEKRGSHTTFDNIKGAKLSNANLKGANLQRAYLRQVNLRDTHLEGAKLDGANLLGAIR